MLSEGLLVFRSERRLIVVLLFQAGEDRGWVKDHVRVFQQKADAGDGDFVDLLGDIKAREHLSGE